MKDDSQDLLEAPDGNTLPKQLPRRPDVIDIKREESGFGGRWKRRVFARLVWQGMEPYEAFLKADYPVKGINSNVGHSVYEARKRATEMASASWCREWGMSWSIDAKDQVKMAVPEAVAVLIDGLGSKDNYGKPSSLAVRCAENLLDRGGIVRSQKVEHDETGGQETRDAKDLIRLIKERLEALEGPVRRPPALEAIEVVATVKKDGDGEPG